MRRGRTGKAQRATDAAFHRSLDRGDAHVILRGHHEGEVTTFRHRDTRTWLGDRDGRRTILHDAQPHHLAPDFMIEGVPRHRLQLEGVRPFGDSHQEHEGRRPKHLLHHHAVDPQLNARDGDVVFRRNRDGDGAVLHDGAAIHRRNQRHCGLAVPNDVHQLKRHAPVRQRVRVGVARGVAYAHGDEIGGGISCAQLTQPRSGELRPHHRTGIRIALFLPGGVRGEPARAPDDTELAQRRADEDFELLDKDVVDADGLDDDRTPFHQVLAQRRPEDDGLGRNGVRHHADDVLPPRVVPFEVRGYGTYRDFGVRAVGIQRHETRRKPDAAPELLDPRKVLLE